MFKGIKVSCFFSISLLLTSSIIWASEIDTFTAKLYPVKDSLSYINEETQKRIDQALDETNQVDGCSSKRLVKKLKKYLKGDVIGGPIEKIINGHKNPDIDSVHVKRQDSIYRDLTFLDAPIMHLFKSSFGAVVKISTPTRDLFIGADKFGHFFTEGLVYATKAFSQKNGSVYRAVAWGKKTEKGKFGFLTTGVFSHADLAANFRGMEFWASLLVPYGRFVNPRFICENDKFIQTRPFDWSEFVDEGWDESLNCNRFKNSRIKKAVDKRISDLELKSGLELKCQPLKLTCEQMNDLYAPYNENIITTSCQSSIQ